MYRLYTLEGGEVLTALAPRLHYALVSEKMLRIDESEEVARYRAVGDSSELDRIGEFDDFSIVTEKIEERTAPRRFPRREGRYRLETVIDAPPYTLHHIERILTQQLAAQILDRRTVTDLDWQFTVPDARSSDCTNELTEIRKRVPIGYRSYWNRFVVSGPIASVLEIQRKFAQPVTPFVIETTGQEFYARTEAHI